MKANKLNATHLGKRVRIEFDSGLVVVDTINGITANPDSIEIWTENLSELKGCEPEYVKHSDDVEILS